MINLIFDLIGLLRIECVSDDTVEILSTLWRVSSLGEPRLAKRRATPPCLCATAYKHLSLCDSFGKLG